VFGIEDRLQSAQTPRHEELAAAFSHLVEIGHNILFHALG